jgi:hypothetical protein
MVSHPIFINVANQSGSNPAVAVKSYIVVDPMTSSVVDRYNLVFEVKNGTSKTVKYTYGTSF